LVLEHCPPNGISSTATITTTAGCAWTASSSVPSWLTVSPFSGVGTGSVHVTAAPNVSRFARTGVVSIAQNSFTVIQRERRVSPAILTVTARPTSRLPSIGRPLVRPGSSASATHTWGGGADIPVAGDYDGDGKTDVAIFRPSTGMWFIINSSTSSGLTYSWGGSDDVPVPADYDGDGKTDVAVFRPSTGVWFILNSSTSAGSTTTWGGSGDIPVPGDYDGDRRADVAVPTLDRHVVHHHVGDVHGQRMRLGRLGRHPILKRP
jgi:hypothetical protein